MSDVVCFYHKDCFDGTAAAYAVSCRHPEAMFIAIQYGDAIDIPALSGKDVVVVDFSFPWEATVQIIAVARSFTVLDHHVTFSPIAKQLLTEYEQDPRVTVVYDPTRSGALIAWQHYMSQPAPELIRIISDRDLWKFDFPYTRAVMAVVGLYSYDIESYRELFREYGRVPFAIRGNTILEKIDQDVDNVIRSSLRIVTIEDLTFPLINCPYFLASDSLAKLAKRHPFAVSYYDSSDHRIFSIRSDASAVEDVDVSLIAKRFGGGGHRHAAGWRVPRSHPHSKL